MDPVRVIVRSESPELALVGEIEERAGAGYKPVKKKWNEVAPPRAMGLGLGGPKELTMM